MIMILEVIWIHYFSDFLLQNDKMAINKSSSNKWLGIHCLIYSIPFLIFGLKFAIILGISHFIVDFFTSRGTTKLWIKGKRHWFFCLIGLDQTIHITLLVLQIKLFGVV